MTKSKTGESFRSSKNAKTYDEGNKTMIKIGNKSAEIGAGQSDDVRVYDVRDRRGNKKIVVTSENPRLGYAGIEIRDKSSLRKEKEQFWDNIQELDQTAKSAFSPSKVTKFGRMSDRGKDKLMYDVLTSGYFD